MSESLRFGGIFDLETKAERLHEVELELADPGVWDDPERAQQLGKERVELEQVVTVLTGLQESLSELSELAEPASDENDADALDDVAEELGTLETSLAAFVFSPA